MAARSIDDWPLVGRDDVVERGWTALTSSPPLTVVVAGAAGVGKSRVAAELTERARASGWVVRRATASRAAASIPFGALAALLPTSLDSADPLELLRLTQDSLLETTNGASLLLWVDDAHLLDPGSGALIGQLGDTGSIHMVLTVRTGEPCSDAIEQIWRGNHGVRIDLTTLDAELTARLLEEVLGEPVAAGAAHRFWQRSSGNPLMLREVVRAALLSGALREESGAWLLADTSLESPALRDLVDQRLGHLTGDDRAALELLSLADVLSAAQLEALVPSVDVVGLEERGLVDVEQNRRRIEVRLAHPVYGEVIGEGLPILRRRRDHGRLIDLITEAGARRREDTLRMASWSLDSDHRPPAEVLSSAAEQALARLDLPLAERLGLAAVEEGAGVGAMIIAGNAAWRQGRHDEALELMGRAAELALDEQEVADVADAHAYVLEVAGRPSDAWQVLTVAAERVEGPRRDLLDSQAAILSTLAGRSRDTLQAVASVRSRAASRAGPLPPLVRLRIDYAETFALGLQGRYEEAEELAQASHDWLTNDPDVHMPPALALLGRVASRVWAGHLSDAATDAEAVEQAALQLGDRDAEWTTAMYRGRVEYARGQVSAALEHFVRAAAIATALGDGTGVRWTRAGQALCRGILGIGAREETDDHVEPSTEGLFEVDLVWRAAAWALVTAGQFEYARRRLEEAAALARDLGQEAVEVTIRHDLVRLGDEDQSSRLAELAAAIPQPLPIAAMKRAQAAHDPDQLLDVAQSLQQIGSLLEAAECATTAAEGFRRERRSREATAASRLASGWLSELPVVATPALVTPLDSTPLTAREREEAALAARQLSAAEIGERLHLSRRTVENHLQRIYTKLGISSRTELAASLGME